MVMVLVAVATLDVFISHFVVVVFCFVLFFSDGQQQCEQEELIGILVQKDLFAKRRKKRRKKKR